jgi:hypothetical protein
MSDQTILSAVALNILQSQYLYFNNGRFVSEIMQTVSFDELCRISLTNPQLALLGFGGYSAERPSALILPVSSKFMTLIREGVNKAKLLGFVSCITCWYNDEEPEDNDMSFIVRTIATSRSKSPEIKQLLSQPGIRSRICNLLKEDHKREFIAAYLNNFTDANLIMSNEIKVDRKTLSLLRSDLIEDVSSRITKNHSLMQVFIEWLMEDPFNYRYTNSDDNIDILVVLLQESIQQENYTTLICNWTVDKFFTVINGRKLELACVIRDWASGNEDNEIVIPLRLISSYNISDDRFCLLGALKLLSKDTFVKGVDIAKVIKFCETVLPSTSNK